MRPDGIVMRIVPVADALLRKFKLTVVVYVFVELVVIVEDTFTY